MLRSQHFHSRKSGTVFKSLCGIDAEHGFAQVGVKFVEHRLTQACRTAAHHTRDDAAGGVAGLADLFDQPDHFVCHGRIGATHVVGFGLGKVKFRVGRV